MASSGLPSRRHVLTITARRFAGLRWPTATTTWEKDDPAFDCEAAELFAQRLRDSGAVRVVVQHRGCDQ